MTILDDKGQRRRFRASNYQSATRVKDFICTMPMRLDDGWNQIQFNLAEFTRRAYGMARLYHSDALKPGIVDSWMIVDIVCITFHWLSCSGGLKDGHVVVMILLNQNACLLWGAKHPDQMQLHTSKSN